MASFNSIFSLKNESSEIGNGDIEFKKLENKIELKDVSFSYVDNFNVLNNVDYVPCTLPLSQGRAQLRILEDNDPSVYKSRAAEDAKKTAGISPMSCPKRSPEMNTLDYGFWYRMKKRLWGQEAAFPKSKREARGECIKRLQTALRVPASVLGPLAGFMERRCKALESAGGKRFEK